MLFSSDSIDLKTLFNPEYLVLATSRPPSVFITFPQTVIEGLRTINVSGTAYALYELEFCLSQVYAAEQAQQSDDDQICRDDIVQQLGHDQNKHAGEQRYQGFQT